MPQMVDINVTVSPFAIAIQRIHYCCRRKVKNFGFEKLKISDLKITLCIEVESDSQVSKVNNGVLPP